MSKYFKFVGITELVAFAIGMVVYFVQMIAAIKAETSSYYGGGDSMIIFIWILGLIAIIVIGPAIGLLFYKVGKMLEI